MKDRNELLVLKAEVAEDIKAIEQICLKIKTKEDELKDKEIDFFETGAFGYLLHNFYNACENILLRVAKVFENTIEDDEWHKDLLQRMSLEIENIRPAVINGNILPKLDEYRRFRHLFRHSYGFQLNWDKVKNILVNLEETKTLFINNIKNFLIFIEKLIKELA